MQDEAEIVISGVKLTQAESMTLRLAIDTLADVLVDSVEEKEDMALNSIYVTSLARIQTLLDTRPSRKQ